MAPKRAALLLTTPCLLLLLGAHGATGGARGGRGGGSEPTLQQSTLAGAEMAGELLVTEPGVKDTVAEIMRRDALLPKGPPALRTKTELEVPYEPRPNPEAPAVSSWPPFAAGVEAGGTRAPQSVGVSFDTTDFSHSGWVPPDTIGAVGPTQVLVISNGRIRLFDKAGVPGPLDTTGENFFAAAGGDVNGAVDPHVRYDRLSGRWYLVAISLRPCPNNIMVATSSGPEISGTTSFTYFKFTPETGFIDYPTLGVDRNALYIGGNIPTCDGTTWEGVSAYVVRKADLVAGIAPTVTVFRQLQVAGILTPQGVDNDDPAANEGYLVGVDFNMFSRLGIRRVLNPGSTAPTLSAQLNVNVPTTDNPLPQPQPSPGPPLNGVDGRLFAAAAHRNKISGLSTLWTAHNFRVDATGVAGGNRNGSRWYEIQNLTTTPTLRQAGTLFDPAATTPFGYWMPSIAMSGQGHAAIGASRASADPTNGFASIAVAGRLRTGALGSLQGPTLARASTFLYDTWLTGEERWGDYSQTVVDPNDDQTLWTFQEYANATNNWCVRAIELKAPPPAAPVSAIPSAVPSGVASVDLTITGASVNGSEFFDPGHDVGGPGFARRIAAAVGGGVTLNGVAFAGPTSLRLNVSTLGAPIGPKDLAVTNPDGQAATGTGVFTVNGCPLLTVGPATLPGATAGVAYSQRFAESGGTAPVGWLLYGALPSGISFNGTSGTLSGTPAQAGVFPITALAIDANDCQGAASVMLVVNPAAAFVPRELVVDANGNSVFELGETVAVAPSWRNSTGVPASVTGTLSAFTSAGDPNPPHIITDGAGDYGTVASGATASCSATGNCYTLALGTPTARPQAHWDASVLETLSTGEAKSWALHVGESFTDVPKTSGYYRYVETILHKGVTTGCGTTTYCPATSASRQQMTVFALRSKGGAGYTPPACGATPLFPDVPVTSAYCPFVEEMSRRGVVSGCGGGNFCPTSVVTRAQMAVFVLKTLDPATNPPACGTPVFGDVPASSPFCRYIEELARRGVVSGCGGGNYCPANPVTRGQMGVFLTLGFGLTLYGG